MSYDDFDDMQVEIECELGQTKITLKDFLGLEKGSVLSLNKGAGENAEVFLNKRIIGRGEILVFEKQLAVRINEVPDHNSMISYLKEEKNI